MGNFFDDLVDDFSGFTSSKPSATRAPSQTFPCQSCGGSGKYRGVRVHQADDTCFACGGRGYFKTSYADRMKRKATIQENKIRRMADFKELLEQQEPGLFRFMAENQDWNDFFCEMVVQINTGKALSPNQQAACVRMRDKTLASRAAKEEQKAQEQTSRNVAIDLQPIHAMFAKASEAGLKKLVYRAEGLVLTPAKAHSANAGGIYVKTKGGEYLGKVMGQTFMACREATAEHKAALNVIAANPAEAAAAYGKRTGECSCCGRELTDPVSIAAGIGPICSSKWGF